MLTDWAHYQLPKERILPEIHHWNNSNNKRIQDERWQNHYLMRSGIAQDLNTLEDCYCWENQYATAKWFPQHPKHVWQSSAQDYWSTASKNLTMMTAVLCYDERVLCHSLTCNRLSQRSSWPSASNFYFKFEGFLICRFAGPYSQLQDIEFFAFLCVDSFGPCHLIGQLHTCVLMSMGKKELKNRDLSDFPLCGNVTRCHKGGSGSETHFFSSCHPLQSWGEMAVCIKVWVICQTGNVMRDSWWTLLLSYLALYKKYPMDEIENGCLKL